MYDYIIIGQGIAGTILSHTFLNFGKSVYIINQTSSTSASAVAAGIYNPITGKRLVKTWKADILFPFLETFYFALEKTLGTSFLHRMPIYKPFNSIAEQNLMISSGNLGGDFCDGSFEYKGYSDYINNDYGGFQTKMSGYIDVKAFLKSSKEYLNKLDFYYEGVFHYNDLVINNDSVEWKGIKAKKLIFCEGSAGIENPFFKWLPFLLTKGEIIDISCENFPENVIFNKSVFILPKGNSNFRIGATYEWDYADSKISMSGLETLKNKLQSIIKKKYLTVGQECGIRPTTKDRRPLLGFHPQLKTLGIFNGLGTKGVSLAPFFAKQFYDHIELGTELDPEVDINRFYSLQ